MSFSLKSTSSLFPKTDGKAALGTTEATRFASNANDHVTRYGIERTGPYDIVCHPETLWVCQYRRCRYTGSSLGWT
ncbi:hypothetical protein BDP27DRAFT_1315061 [Rhodocollybia butyracea]|uniref:Uncharacterized protein n=1 Tax=Rhodocollybia butyracea TaxID=206335 RepID=A0A9P5PZG6_9AGAR|nr:hypothetical protein BDP27DRAFT_1315061 [Rhodocollybia butyracea]